jgi:hypothetical protein
VSSPIEAEPAAPRPGELRERLARIGIATEVHVDGKLAVLVLRRGAPEPHLDAAGREAIVAAARECGFTHVALELVEVPAPTDEQR